MIKNKNLSGRQDYLLTHTIGTPLTFEEKINNGQVAILKSYIQYTNSKTNII